MPASPLDLSLFLNEISLLFYYFCMAASPLDLIERREIYIQRKGEVGRVMLGNHALFL